MFSFDSNLFNPDVIQPIPMANTANATVKILIIPKLLNPPIFASDWTGSSIPYKTINDTIKIIERIVWGFFDKNTIKFSKYDTLIQNARYVIKHKRV